MFILCVCNSISASINSSKTRVQSGDCAVQTVAMAAVMVVEMNEHSIKMCIKHLGVDWTLCAYNTLHHSVLMFPIYKRFCSWFSPTKFFFLFVFFSSFVCFVLSRWLPLRCSALYQANTMLPPQIVFNIEYNGFIFCCCSSLLCAQGWPPAKNQKKNLRVHSAYRTLDSPWRWL